MSIWRTEKEDQGQISDFFQTHQEREQYHQHIAVNIFSLPMFIPLILLF
jgi:hypothetical protein